MNCVWFFSLPLPTSNLGRRSWSGLYWWTVPRQTAVQMWWGLWRFCCTWQTGAGGRWWQWTGEWLCSSSWLNAGRTSSFGAQLQGFCEDRKEYRVWDSYILWCLTRKREFRIRCWSGHGKKFTWFLYLFACVLNGSTCNIGGGGGGGYICQPVHFRLMTHDSHNHVWLLLAIITQQLFKTTWSQACK